MPIAPPTTSGAGGAVVYLKQRPMSNNIFQPRNEAISRLQPNNQLRVDSWDEKRESAHTPF